MFCMGIINALWTLYIKYINDSDAFKSAGTGELIFVINAFTTISYVHDPRLIVAAVIGGFIGTFLTVKYNKNTPKL